jgi:hypothetical protein
MHVAAGLMGLALGPVALFAPATGRLGSRARGAYHAAMLAVCLSAVGLAALRWQELWWFAALAAFSYALARRGHDAARRRRPGWRRGHITGVGGSYIALVTALLVVSADGAILTWVVPTLIGVPIIHVARARAARGDGRPPQPSCGPPSCARSEAISMTAEPT